MRQTNSFGMDRTNLVTVTSTRDFGPHNSRTFEMEIFGFDYPPIVNVSADQTVQKTTMGQITTDDVMAALM